MKITLINSIVSIYQEWYQLWGYNYGLGYMQAVLDKAGHDTEYIIIGKDNGEEVMSHLVAEKPDIIAISVTTPEYNHIRSIVPQLKKSSGAFIVLGGVHFTLNPESMAEIPDADAVIIGEGEYPLLELASALENKDDFTKIRSGWFRKGCQVIKNPVRPPIQDINTLPFPEKGSVDYQKILEENSGVNRFIFSRGCPYDCSYCCNKAISEVYPSGSKYYRFLTPENSIELIRRDARKYQFSRIIFDDDILTMNKAWFYRFMELYKKEFSYPFRCNLRVETVTEDMIIKLKEAGAEDIAIGIEHGNEEFRRKVLNRHMSNRQIEQVFEWCEKHHLKHKDDFVMVGFPYETKELFLDTVRLCRKLNVDNKPSIFYPYTNTGIECLCREKGWVIDRTAPERQRATIDIPGFPKEEIELCREVFQTLVRHKEIPLDMPLAEVKRKFILNKEA